MKKMLFMAMMMTIAISATAMPYNTARNEALFLSDKMAYELGLDEAQYEAVYQLNLDYLMGLNARADLYGSRWSIRDRGLVRVLTAAQYNLYMTRSYFYRPVSWGRSAWVFGVYDRYHRNHFFRHHPPVAPRPIAVPRYGHRPGLVAGPRPGAHRHNPGPARPGRHGHHRR
jgi:hypothetical protein